MTFLEALKSGKRYRRQIWGKHDPAFWLEAISQTDTNNKYLGPTISYSSILADDWEVEEVRVTISASDLKTAWVKACENVRDYDNTTPSHWLCVELKKELGL